MIGRTFLGLAPALGLALALTAVTASAQQLNVNDVNQILSAAASEAWSRGAAANIAVVDRVGNVLGVLQMNGAPSRLRVTSGALRYAASSEVNSAASPLERLTRSVAYPSACWITC